MLTETDAAGTMAYEYNTLNLQTKETRVFADLPNKPLVVTRTYKPDTQLDTVTDAANRVVTYNYNNRGFLDTVKYTNTTLATYAYSPNGKVSGIQYGNGNTATHTYDSLDRVDDITIKNAQNTILFKESYEYDAESNRVRLLQNGVATTTYSYDNLNQLKTVDYQTINGIGDDLTYNYDIYGNRQTSANPFGTTNYSYTPNTNELLSTTINNNLVISSVFDDNGSLTEETRTLLGKPQQKTGYTWDTENRLAQISVSYQNTPAFMPARANNVVNFAYDNSGNRVKKSTNGDNTYYFNNGLTVLNEIDNAGTVTKTLVKGNENIAEIDKDGILTYTHQDILGSTVLLTNTAGAVVGSYEYQPFGELAGYAGSKETNYTFTGQEYDPESDLFYYNARYYNPTLGRFISKDPILGRDGDSLSKNEYIYVKNNPLRYTDPSGEVTKEIQEQLDLNTLVWMNYVNGAGGYAYGMGESAYGLVDQVNRFNNPMTKFGVLQEMMIAAYNYDKEVYRSTKDLYRGLSTSPANTWDEIKNGAGIYWNEFMNKPAFEQGRTVGHITFNVEVMAVGWRMMGGSGAAPNSLTSEQILNLNRFQSKLPTKANPIKIYDLPNGGKAFQSSVPSNNIPGSYAVYEKQVGWGGNTLEYTKTTYDPFESILHVHDKIRNVNY